jgi:hypothetical protein
MNIGRKSIGKEDERGRDQSRKRRRGEEYSIRYKI